MIIIGITGTLGAGKGTVVDFLVKEKGFRHFSVRKYLVKRLNEEEIEVNRDTIVEMGNRLRKENSPSFLAEELLKEALKSKKNCVIESIRTEGEINALRKTGNFILLAIDADPKERYRRILKRDSATDHITFEEFLEDEKREMTSTDPNKQNLVRCMELADYKIDNDRSFKELDIQVSMAVHEIEKSDKKRKR